MAKYILASVGNALMWEQRCREAARLAEWGRLTDGYGSKGTTARRVNGR